MTESIFSGFIQENTIFTRMKQKSIVLVGSVHWARTFKKSAGNKWENVDNMGFLASNYLG